MDQLSRLNLIDNAWQQAKGFLDEPSRLQDQKEDLQGLGVRLLDKRAANMRGQISELSASENLRRLQGHFERLAKQSGGFEAYKNFCEQELAGIVFTAHPTFSLAPTARDYLENALRGESNTADTVTSFHPLRSPALEDEMYEAERAVRNSRSAIRAALKISIAVAAQYFPDEWRSFSPRFITVASWVGFDLDGRTDIDWSKSQSFRYRVALDGLEVIGAMVADLEGDEALKSGNLDTIKAGIKVFEESFTLGHEILEDSASGSERFAALNKAAIARLDDKEASLNAIDQALEAIINSDASSATLQKVSLLRAEWHAFGMGLSHIHFRLNAVQLHNAIRPEIGLKRSPDHSASRRHYLSAITELLDQVEPVSIHYGTLARENTTARRVFMLAAQFQKHFDGKTPIRMLVAESDTPFTLLTALYYARLFGVDDHVEISPLFETDIGLQRGDRVIAELIENKHFLAYIKSQGRFCIQLGFSDSGRYIGQLAAGLAIERFKLRVVDMWEKQGLGDIQLLFFDTHGESIGRGAHPKSLNDRFLYTQTKEVRRRLNELDAPHKHEVSFQGGDGYLWFADRDMSLAVVTDFLTTRLEYYDPSVVDPLYEDSGWSLDFFLTLKEHQDKLAAHTGYVAAIDSIGRNLLYPTGSRASKRQMSGGTVQALDNISQLRAIPHNAILQQLGFMANSLTGLGGAIRLAPEKFAATFETSERLQRLIGMAQGASEHSDALILKAYQEVVSPDGWMHLAESEANQTLRSRMRRMTATLEPMFKHDEMAALLRDIRRDAGRAKDAVSEHGAGFGEPSEDLYALHQLRLALMQFIYMKAMEVPRFSSRLDVSLKDLLAGLFHFDVDETLDALAEIFPVTLDTVSDSDYGEQQSFRPRQEGYIVEHDTIFEPIREAYSLMLMVSGLIAIEIGAFG